MIVPIDLDHLNAVVKPLRMKHVLHITETSTAGIPSPVIGAYVRANRIKQALLELTGRSAWSSSPHIRARRSKPRPHLTAALDSDEGVLFVWDHGWLRLRDTFDPSWRIAIGWGTVGGLRATEYAGRPTLLANIVEYPLG